MPKSVRAMGFTFAEIVDSDVIDGKKMLVYLELSSRIHGYIPPVLKLKDYDLEFKDTLGFGRLVKLTFRDRKPNGDLVDPYIIDMGEIPRDPWSS